VLVEGVDRASIEKLSEGEFFSAEVTPMPDVERYEEREMDVLTRSMITQFEQYVKLNKKVPPEILTSLAGIEQAGRLADTVAAHMSAEALREAEGSRDSGRAQAPRAHARGDRRRDGRPADREAHSRPRQAADGEEPARVLPE
jgi:hypothetical protein